MNTGYANPYAVAEASSEERAAFIKKTYLHLAGALAVFAALSAALLQMPWAQQFAYTASQYWLVVLGGFMVVSWIADKWAMSDTSRGKQYLGLGISVAGWAILFLPLLYAASTFAPGVIQKAAITTGILVAGLTVVVFVTGKDFSFMKSFLMVGGFVAFGIIVAAIIFKFQLGIIFAGAMVLFACASILYTTSNIVHHYRSDQYVAASLSLFSGIVLLLWYIIQIFMSRE